MDRDGPFKPSNRFFPDDATKSRSLCQLLLAEFAVRVPGTHVYLRAHPAPPGAEAS